MMKMRSRYLLLLFLLIPIRLYPASVPEIINVRQYPDSAGLYEKFEISLQLKCEFVNPFDPDEIDIEAVFTSPSGKVWTIPGFYCLSRSTLWKVRFSPDEPGIWNYKIMVRDKNGTADSEGLSFVAVDSGRNGPLMIAENRRYLRHSDGSDFYGVGLWYNDGYEGYGSGRIKGEELDRLKSLGINFISTFITPMETWGSGIGRYDQNICARNATCC
jgi:hypothetical protein